MDSYTKFDERWDERRRRCRASRRRSFSKATIRAEVDRARCGRAYSSIRQMRHAAFERVRMPSRAPESGSSHDRAGDDLLALAQTLTGAGDIDRALAVLELAAEREASVADALSRRGDRLRAHGDLREAAGVFRLLGQRRPDDLRATYLSALLSGAPAALPPSRPAPWPAAFARLEDFLDGARHRELLQAVTADTARFEPSTVGGMGPHGPEPRVDLDTRTSFRVVGMDGAATWLRPLVQHCLGPISAQLGLGPFQAGMIE
jgi:tetratricopeptide (TPR) repeat protein